MKPVLLILAAFLLLIGAWSSLIFIAVRHTPQTIQTTTSTNR